ncbi:MAG TPA: helix-turn-helix transcriptional regulator [Phycisphaerae bacterium]|nr:helix-turn-helix transcriptional regulator [Phycisphaerae bacterium]
MPNKTTNLKRDKQFSASDKTVGDLIVAARKEVRLTPEKLAEISGIHRQWIGRWERNRALPNKIEWGMLQIFYALKS